MYICIYVFMYICICVCVYIFICINVRQNSVIHYILVLQISSMFNTAGGAVTFNNDHIIVSQCNFTFFNQLVHSVKIY